MRSDTPAAAVDILDALLTERDTAQGDAFPGQEALDRLVRRAMPPATRPSRKNAQPLPRALTAVAPSPASAARAPTPKRKVTHYIGQATSDRLEAARLALCQPGIRRVTKSGLAEAALSLALDAFETAGAESGLARRLRETPQDPAARLLR